MTAELRDLEPPAGGWTTDDLDELPESHHRYELIDGALVVSPSPTNMHQTIAARLLVALEESCPLEYDVTQAVEIRVSKLRSFIPDLLVTTAEAAASHPAKFTPHEVVLVVEVVSPGSLTMDRVTKAALYAQAGIPFYWRVETTGGIVIHTSRLAPDSSVYVPTGEFGDAVVTDDPWRVEIPISRITPRQFRPGAV